MVFLARYKLGLRSFTQHIILKVQVIITVRLFPEYLHTQAD